jgi:hypothetical protein
MESLVTSVGVFQGLSKALQEVVGQSPEARGLLAQASGILDSVVTTVTGILACTATLQGEHLVMQVDMDALRSQVAQLQQAGSASTPAASSKQLAAVTSRLEALEAASQQLQTATAAAAETAQAAQACLQKAGLCSEAAAQQLKAAADKGAAAYMQQDQRAAQVREVERRVGELEGRQQQLQARAAAAARKGCVVAWAPVGTTAQQVEDALLAAGTISKHGLLGAHLEYAPQVPAASGGGQRSGAAAREAGSDGRGAPPSAGGASSSRAAEEAAAAGAGSSKAAEAAAAAGAGSSRAAETPAAAGAGSSSGGGRAAGDTSRGRRPMSLFKVYLSSPELEWVVLGGRTRAALSKQSLPVFVDKVLTEEERAQRRALVPTARKLRAEGKRVRWRGAQLQVRVQLGGQGKPTWEVVRQQQQPPSPRGGDGGTAGAQDRAGAAAPDLF